MSTRRILPHAPRSNFEGVVLDVGEIVVDEANGYLYSGNGITAGGTSPYAEISQIASLNTDGDYEVRAVKDSRGDDAPWATVVPSAGGTDIRVGTTVSPANGAGALFKLSKTEMVSNLSEMGGNKVDNRYNAAMYVAVNSMDNSLAQPCAILGTAQGSPDGTDVLAVGGWGRTTGDCGGYAYGGYFEARSESTVNGGAHGLEARSKNLTGLATPASSGEVASKFMAIWATVSDGNGNIGVGVGSGDGVFGWDIGFQATSSGKYRTAGFSAEGLGAGLGTASAYLARSSHFIGLNFQDASFTGFAILLPNGTSPTGGIRFGSTETVYQDSSDGVRFGASGRVGFGKASVPRPTMPATATDLATAIARANAAVDALINVGLAQ
jgi:hypothetical protein